MRVRSQGGFAPVAAVVAAVGRRASYTPLTRLVHTPLIRKAGKHVADLLRV